jgi:acetyltransferase-like isoleucine patch superfamily enzyme
LFNSVNIVGNVSIGDYSAIEGPTNILGSFEKIEIGKFCSIGWGCNIINHNHKFKRPSSHYFSSHVLGGKIQDDIEIKGPITIGNDVWIGANVSILPGIQIGDGVIIGAGSIVTKNIPAYAIVSGNPAEIVKYRFSDNEIEQLINAKWWDWPLEKIKRNKEFFLNNYSITNLKNISE